MAYLNQQEREDLAKELSRMTFNQARGRMRALDKQCRLAYLRNVQNAGKWATRFELHGLGTRVTLIESFGMTGTAGKQKADYQLVEVIVEPAPYNRT